MLRQTAFLATVLLLTACVSAGGGGGGGKKTIKEQMKSVTQPAADTLFPLGSKVDPNFDPMPLSDAEWKKALDAAKDLKASADMMLLPANLKDQGDFKTAATQMQTLAAQAIAGAQAKDGKKFSSAANDLGDNCTTCHRKYKNQTGS